jgi:hypothetical protein
MQYRTNHRISCNALLLEMAIYVLIYLKLIYLKLIYLILHVKFQQNMQYLGWKDQSLVSKLHLYKPASTTSFFISKNALSSSFNRDWF